ncbi:MAG: c-type cytochrome, partial [Planctomycetales bacterium]|nr:c-type cytochrome [Planctomycetales bacterium]
MNRWLEKTVIYRCSFFLWLLISTTALAQIPAPDDAPRPLSPEESSRCFQVPNGFRMELVASEPLIREPTGVCWDDQGRLFVCEMHGYNLEGQYDIDELNQTGNLDRVVRRIQADERHKEAALKETYGTIKLLRDTDNDGRMDDRVVWADRLPPCLGICPANGGIIAACHTKILFLEDRDGDDQAEVREVLFEGFQDGPLERSVNAPQWGPDQWIYFGSSAGGGNITGKYLPTPVSIPNTDFRIRADGSEIQPITGRTHTLGFTFTEHGDRFVVSTREPGIFVAPISWQELARNPNVSTPRMEVSATTDTRVWPTSHPHPWRIRRADDPGFSKYYSDRYGMEETAPNGYFTSACAPLVYQDSVLPGLNGHLLSCEPAQNLVHRSIVERDGIRLRLHRPPEETQSEFLSSSDPWFHAISLNHAPDGNIYIVDFYREIIEDYSAIPRYLQQQYGLMAGQNQGRIWRLTHNQTAASPISSDMSRLTPLELANEITSHRFWRRQTSRRLLVEYQESSKLSNVSLDHVYEFLVAQTKIDIDIAGYLNVLSTLDELRGLQSTDVDLALKHSEPIIRRRGLQLAKHWLGQNAISEPMFESIFNLARDPSPVVQLQLALSLGECSDERAIDVLIQLAQAAGSDAWMRAAILSSVPNRAGKLLSGMLRSPDKLGQALDMLEPLATAIANRRDTDELSQALEAVLGLNGPQLQLACLRGMRESFTEPTDIQLSLAARQAIMSLAQAPEANVRREALALVTLLRVESPTERAERLAAAMRNLEDVRLSTQDRMSALLELSEESAPEVTNSLMAALSSGTPQLRSAILQALINHKQRLPMLLDAFETQQLAIGMLDALGRATLLELGDSKLRARAAELLNSTPQDRTEQVLRYQAALNAPRNVSRGEAVFRTACSQCHHAHGIGQAVGPDLQAEFLRAEETIIGDVLGPNEKIADGYGTYAVVTNSGHVITGILGNESPTSITLLQAEGKSETVLRKNVEQLRALSVSMMPEDLYKTVSPTDLADVLAWLRRPPVRLTLLDENREIVAALKDGSGTAEFISSD